MKIIIGMLKIGRSKKGALYAQFIPEGGNGNALPLSFWKPDSEIHNDRQVELQQDGSTVISLKLVDGDYLYQKTPIHPQNDQKGQCPQFTDSFQVSKTLLSKDVKLALRGFRTPDNFSLKFYKGARFDTQNSAMKFILIKTEKGKVEYSLNADFGDIDFSGINLKNLKTAERLGFVAGNLSEITVDNPWRWVSGLGNASVYENGMTLHHIYGIPYIPGSGVKGMIRSWIIEQCFEKNETLAFRNPLFQVIFGHGKQDDIEGQQGRVYFFDAFPTQTPKVEPDVMNNHYQEYYEGNTPPADWLNPIPIFFMTVKGGRLRFIIGVKEKYNNSIGEISLDNWNTLIIPRFNNSIHIGSSLLKLTEAWLRDALEHHGVGAKTAVGYGRMK